MTKDEYELWVNHPLTVKFHQYLKDNRLVMMEKWATGGFDEIENIRASARSQQIDEIVNLSSVGINEFYDLYKGVLNVSEN